MRKDNNKNPQFQISTSAVPSLQRGMERLERGDLIGAVADLTQVIDIEGQNDGSAFALLNRGVAYAHLGEIDQAIRDWTKAISFTQHKDIILPALDNRAKAFANLGNFDAAIKDMTSIIQILPDYAEAYNIRSHYRQSQNDFRGRVADLDRAIMLQLNNYVYYLNRGNTYRNIGNSEKALADFNKSIQIEPRDGDTYFYRGSLYHQLQQYEKALEDLNLAVMLSPQESIHYSNRAETKLALGNINSAIEDFNQALKLNPTENHVRSRLCSTYARRSIMHTQNNLIDYALADANRAIQLQPENCLGYFARGNALHNQSSQSAMSDYSKAISLKPDFANAYAFRAMLFQSYGNLNKAFNDFKVALSLVPMQDEWHFHMQSIVNALANDGYTFVAMHGSVFFADIDWDEFLQARLNRTANYDPVQGIVLPPNRK